jgi:hypothetical protein
VFLLDSHNTFVSGSASNSLVSPMKRNAFDFEWVMTGSPGATIFLNFDWLLSVKYILGKGVKSLYINAIRPDHNVSWMACTTCHVNCSGFSILEGLEDTLHSEVNGVYCSNDFCS